MIRREISEADLHAWLDGALPAHRRAEIEAFLAANPDTAERLAAYRRNDQEIAAAFDPVLEEPVPPGFALAPRARRRNVWPYAAAIACFLAGGVAGWYAHGFRAGEQQRAGAPQWAKRAAMAHVVYSPEVRHPVEVAAEQEAHLVAWLSKRLGTPLKIPRLDNVGYGLVGGRLLPGDQGPVAHFMYQDAQGQRLTLYVRTNREQTKETAFRFAHEGNVRVFYWIDRGLGYALSGEIPKEDLLRVANAVYQQINP